MTHDDSVATGESTPTPTENQATTETGEPRSYEEARDELVAVVGKLESGGVSLQESVALWERGEELAKTCQRWLDGIRERLDAVIAADADADDSADDDKADT